mmetsp:Transcript_14203/g.17590  ORF Transcript_14203/g.17590 Transcript_14203/m.17590 type:complete len:80 (+) Transcript_14203:138-377(+)
MKLVEENIIRQREQFITIKTVNSKQTYISLMKRSVSQSDVDEKKNVDKDTSTEPKSQKQKVDEKETNIAEGRNLNIFSS